MRTITLPDDLPTVAYEAMGKLCTWSMPDADGFGYDQVTISRDGNGNDLIAYYRNSVDQRMFVIGAIWRKEESSYTYHS